METELVMGGLVMESFADLSHPATHAASTTSNRQYFFIPSPLLFACHGPVGSARPRFAHLRHRFREFRSESGEDLQNAIL